MMDDKDSLKLRNNPVFVIGVAIVIAMTMITIGILMFYSSPTRLTLDGLEENKRELGASKIDNTKTGPITAGELKLESKMIEDNITKLNDEADYAADRLTDSLLGL